MALYKNHSVRRNSVAAKACFLVVAFWLAMATSANAQTTVSFQQGVGGYAGTLDIIIGPVTAGIPDFGNVNGSQVEEQFLDGRYYDVDPSGSNDDDKQLLIRFDEIFGMGAGQIPAGARINSASLIITTGATSGNARSGGPYGVAQMLVPFDEFTSWFDFFDLGATFAGGDSERPLDRGFRGPMEASVDVPSHQVADVTRAVQNWSDGVANEGLVIRAGTTDGWQIFTSGASLADVRPRLEVTYDTTSPFPVQTVTLQQGLNNYSGTTMVRLNEDDITDDGQFFNHEFLDGPNLAGTSPDDQALIRFDNIFARDGGPIPDNALITDSQLVIDTAPATFSVNVGTNGNYAVHQMLVDWDLSSTYTGFGGDGPDEAGGEVAPPTDLTGAMIADARTHLDVTETVRNWQSGDPNFGFNIQAADTSDGWAIHWLDSDSPPQLLITFSDSPPPMFHPADYNANGTVEQGDLDLVLLNWGDELADPTSIGWNNNFPTGPVDQAELDAVLLNWGTAMGALGSANVPEPATWTISIALLGLFAIRRRIH